MNFCAKTGLLLLAGLFGVAAANDDPAAPKNLTLVASLEPGEWQIRPKSGGEAKLLCLGDVRTLIQPRHPKSICSSFVISNEARQAVIHYTCPGAGHGRTSLKLETPRLVQIETQGIASNSPFQETYEARRTGSCTTGALPGGRVTRPLRFSR